MNYWIFTFRPEMFKTVVTHGVLGVNHQHERRFFELTQGDRFVAYLSQKQLLAGHGELVSEPFVDDSDLFGRDVQYPYRCQVRVDTSRTPTSARDLLWGLSEFDGREMKTLPANYLFLKGGFLRISERDYRWLLDVLEGRSSVARA
ncbi:EVE domain-containing protein [bacterium]|nr:EVE domain-containing protein [bacterium]